MKYIAIADNTVFAGVNLVQAVQLLHSRLEQQNGDTLHTHFKILIKQKSVQMSC